MARATLMCGSALVALGTVFVSGCGAPAPPAAETQQAASHPEQALIEDAVLANRMLAREVGILDVQGHATVRSRIDPNHYYIARFLSPGGVTTSDMIENTLDSNAVAGPRNDQARETYLHGEIYKARPDVMAIVHAHTPELVAFGMSSVPLWSGESKVPVWDIRPFNRGRSGIVSTPALGRAMAETLARNEAVLLWGHGVAVTGSSLSEAVSRAIDLRRTARLQQATIARGDAWKPQVTGQPDSDRTWAYLKRLVLKDTGGRVPTTPPADPVKPADPAEATVRDLTLANRILASQELSILGPDAFGHISVRSPREPNRYFVAPRVSAGGVTAGDIVQRDSTAPEPDTQGLSVHDEVYRARPDVMAVLYARTPEIVALTHGSVKLRPVVNGGAFIGDGLPVFDIGTLDPKQPILANPAFGRGVAAALGKSRGVLLTGDGFVLTGSSLYDLVNQAYALRMNAIIQQQAIALRGKVAYLNDRPVAPAQTNGQTPPAQTQPAAQLGPPEGRAWIYWAQNVSLD